MATKKEKELKKLEKQEKKKHKEKIREQRRKDRIELKKAYSAERLQAFKSAKGIGEIIGFIFVYGRKIVLCLVSFMGGFLFSHFSLFSALLKKFGIITEVVK